MDCEVWDGEGGRWSGGSQDVEGDVTGRLSKEGIGMSVGICNSRGHSFDNKKFSNWRSSK